MFIDNFKFILSNQRMIFDKKLLHDKILGFNFQKLSFSHFLCLQHLFISKCLNISRISNENEIYVVLHEILVFEYFSE